MSKQKILSGITATGKITIGNYIGAIKSFIALQNKYELFIFVADLHALTIDISPQDLAQNRRDIFALYLACGLDAKKVTLFYQSDVPAHTQLGWIFENRTTIGELSRMTQFKDKSQKNLQSNQTTKINTGLLTYPALMASDILLYNPELVPVGEDQIQHLELTRNIAKRFNNSFGQTFNLPQPYSPKFGAKIMSLTDPTKKMSKSDSNHKSYIALLDDPNQAFQKIMKAKTDSEHKVYYGPGKDGINNLLVIYANLKNIDLKSAEAEFKNVTDYGVFKQAVGNVVKQFLEDIQAKYHQAIKDVDKISHQGALKANEVAQKQLDIIKNKIGLRSL